MVKSRKCEKCGEKYRTKVKRGKDTRACPKCGHDNSKKVEPR